jgi:hypothetical protein
MDVHIRIGPVGDELYIQLILFDSIQSNLIN